MSILWILGKMKMRRLIFQESRSPHFRFSTGNFFPLWLSISCPVGFTDNSWVPKVVTAGEHWTLSFWYPQPATFTAHWFESSSHDLFSTIYKTWNLSIINFIKHPILLFDFVQVMTQPRSILRHFEPFKFIKVWCFGKFLVNLEKCVDFRNTEETSVRSSRKIQFPIVCYMSIQLQ